MIVVGRIGGAYAAIDIGLGNFGGKMAHVRAIRASAISASILALTATSAFAGGFAVREQSASLLGSAFAGAATGAGGLSSAFWNPAAFSTAQSGFSTDSSYTLILPSSTLSNGATSVDTAIGNVPLPIGGSDTTDIDKVGVLGSSYAAFRYDQQTVFGISLTSPFGLATEPSDLNWTGRLHGREAEMLTFNVSPTVAYEIAPGVQIAAGLQIEYMRLKLWFASSPALGAASASIKVEDTASIGATAGIILKPLVGTTVGVGFRSSIKHNLDGNLNTPAGAIPVTAKIETPEMVTASIIQAITPGLRLLGTVEWTNWSRIDNIAVRGTPFAIDAHWDDGWFFSGGLEYDYSALLTFRAGGAFESSPIQDPTQRLPQLPDSDRIWATAGATYHYSEWTTVDLGYAHIFFDDAHIHRGALSNKNLILDADVSQDANIVSLGIKTRW